MKPAIILVLLLLHSSGVISLYSAAEDPADYQAVTTRDPGISVAELEWLVKPLTKEELIVEADAWQQLVKEKVREISIAEIANIRQNQQIQKTQQAAKALEAAQKAADEAKAAEEQSGGQTNAATAEEAAKAAEKAQAKLEQAQQAAEEAEQVQNKAEQDIAAMATSTNQPTENAAQPATGDQGETNAAPATLPAETNQPRIDAEAARDAERLDEAAESAKAAAEAKAEAKEQILENLNDLRTERAALLSRLTVVVDELEKKGGEVDSYRKYADSVAAVKVDVTDTSAFVKFITGWLKSQEGGIKWGKNVAKFAGIIVAFYFLAFVVGKTVRKATSKTTKMSGLLREFLYTTARRTVLFIGLLVALSSAGIKVGPLLALIGAAGFVIGFALQGTLSNFASGLLILFYRPFDVGDAVEAGGVAGSISAMNLMSTHFKTWDNKAMIVPNNKIWGDIITNISGTDRRRVDMVFGIGYRDSMEKAQAILEKIVADHPLTLDTPAPTIKVNELGDSSVNFIVRPWVKPADYWTVYWDITRQVKEEFDKQGVSIPFPQRDVHFYQETGEYAGMAGNRAVPELQS